MCKLGGPLAGGSDPTSVMDRPRSRPASHLRLLLACWVWAGAMDYTSRVQWSGPGDAAVVSVPTRAVGVDPGVAPPNVRTGIARRAGATPLSADAATKV